MSLNNIKLEPFLMAEMYKDVLVEDADFNRLRADSNQEKLSLQGPKKPEEKSWRWLGDFKKNILIIVDRPNVVHIPEEQLNFLTTILTACKLSLADVAILNLSTAPARIYKDVQERFRSNVTILLGVTPQQFEMPVSFPEFQIQPFNNCTFLSAPAIEQMENDKLLKSKLWVSLKKIFGL